MSRGPLFMTQSLNPLTLTKKWKKALSLLSFLGSLTNRLRKKVIIRQDTAYGCWTVTGQQLPRNFHNSFMELHSKNWLHTVKQDESRIHALKHTKNAGVRTCGHTQRQHWCWLHFSYVVFDVIKKRGNIILVLVSVQHNTNFCIHVSPPHTHIQPF